VTLRSVDLFIHIFRIIIVSNIILLLFRIQKAPIYFCFESSGYLNQECYLIWCLWRVRFFHIIIEERHAPTNSKGFSSLAPQSCHGLKKNSSQRNFKTRTIKLSKSSSNQSLLRETLRTGKLTNNVLKDLSNDESIFNARPELIESILKLQDMKLLREKSLMITNYCLVPNSQVYNDYHSRETNPGYSRNKFGGFFTKWFAT
jgi:hypothetical protein